MLRISNPGGVTPSDLLVPIGATYPLIATGHVTDGSSRRLRHEALAEGGNHACALAANGAVRCWGRGGSGQLGNGAFANTPAPVNVALESVLALALGFGSSHGCAVAD